jgi:hypothetical protein
VHFLANVKDDKRIAVDIASPEAKASIMAGLRFLGRYTLADRDEHKSATSVVNFAVDEIGESPLQVSIRNCQC